MSYQELVHKYRARRKDGPIDALTAGISFVDNALIDIGVLDGTDIAADALDIVSAALPLATIALTEGTRVLTGKKTGTAAKQDAVYRTVRTGLAMGAGPLWRVRAGRTAHAIPISLACAWRWIAIARVR